MELTKTNFEIELSRCISEIDEEIVIIECEKLHRPSFNSSVYIKFFISSQTPILKINEHSTHILFPKTKYVEVCNSSNSKSRFLQNSIRNVLKNSTICMSLIQSQNVYDEVMMARLSLNCHKIRHELSIEGVTLTSKQFRTLFNNSSHLKIISFYN